MTGLSAATQALVDSVPLGSGSDIVTTTVPYEIDGQSFEGYLAVDSSLAGPLPTVVINHAWYGLDDNARARAQMFARLGYAAFAGDLYGVGVRPADQQAAQAEAGAFYADPELFRARASAALATARDLDVVDAERLAVVGYCFGGTATLELARTGAPARGFALFHAGLPTRDGFGIDRISGPLLVMTGAADPVVPDEAVAAFQDELRGNPDLDWQIVSYSGAPHAFTVPGPSYRELADRRSWAEVQRFLGEVLA